MLDNENLNQVDRFTCEGSTISSKEGRGSDDIRSRIANGLGVSIKVGRIGRQVFRIKLKFWKLSW